jgi:hypothetical protein
MPVDRIGEANRMGDARRRASVRNRPEPITVEHDGVVVATRDAQLRVAFAQARTDPRRLPDAGTWPQPPGYEAGRVRS